MTIRELRDVFKNGIIAIYPDSEIMSIFRLLVNKRLNLDRAGLVLEGNRELTQTDSNFFQESLKRLQNNEPIQYIIGESSFYDLSFKVTPDVLIPRPETEELVQWIIEDVRKDFTNQKLKILDIGTGSGCIAISLTKNLKNVEVSAIDISKEALSIAQENAKTNDVKIHFIQADILKEEKLLDNYNIIVSNPPYVRVLEKVQMHNNVLEFEPKQALYVEDNDPLVFYNKIADLATDSLSAKGVLYFEINKYLGEAVCKLLKRKGFTSIELRKDFLGNDRMVKVSL